MKIDNLLLSIGAMKAGTTWLYSVLDSHPDIFFSEQKEVHYFAHRSKNQKFSLAQRSRFNTFKEMVNYTDVNNTKDIETKLKWYAHYLSNPVDDIWYKKLFKNRSTERYCADFSNLYSHLDDNDWDHIKSISDNLKIIYILRHPLKRLWSHLKFDQQRKGGIDQLPNWSEEKHYEYVKQKYLWENTEYSRVIRSMKRNLHLDQYRIIFFENIHKSPIEELRSIEEFLNIRPHDYNEELLFKKVNTTKSLKMPKYYYSLFKEDFQHEIENIKKLDLDIPESWNDL